MSKPSKKEAENAVLTLIKYISDGDVAEEVLQNTPTRVIKSYEEIFSGYGLDLDKEFSKSFDNSFNYQNQVFIDNIRFSSICEHHMLPIRGFANIAYILDKKAIGLSKIPRIVEVISKKLQLQERMTTEILQTVQKYTEAKGVAVHISAKHDCMNIRGIKKHESRTTTMLFSGEFLENQDRKNEFLSLVNNSRK